MMSTAMLILASSSPRRRQLLGEAGYRFQAIDPDAAVECGLCSEEGPAGLVAELAYRKAADVVRRLVDNSDNGVQAKLVILAADTVAECDGQILGKPADESAARAMLTMLSGRKHRVLTGVCVWPLDVHRPEVRVAVTTLQMDPLTSRQIDDYLASGQWEGKAGAFGYQDRLGWVHINEGSASNVVGLPMEMVAEMLAKAGIAK
jgi:nucleoside triphosphate pyrophosphatase